VARPAPAAPALTGDQRLFLEDRVELARVYLAWHSPAMFAPGDAELDLVSDLLASGKTSRLYRRLVYQMRLATEVAAFQQSRESSSYFQVVATAAPGRTLGDVEAAITERSSGLPRKVRPPRSWRV
jgi:zinc protease